LHPSAKEVEKDFLASSWRKIDSWIGKFPNIGRVFKKCLAATKQPRCQLTLSSTSQIYSPTTDSVLVFSLWSWLMW
jgi:hypothetical protein